MATFRRSAARLSGLSSGHTELFVTISQLKELRTATKAQIAAQESAMNDLFKWSTKEDNRAIKDVAERFSELCAFWTEAQKLYVEELKVIRNHFEVCKKPSNICIDS